MMYKLKYSKQLEREVYVKVIEKLKEEQSGEGDTYGLCYLTKQAYCNKVKITWNDYTFHGGNADFCPTFLTRKPRNCTHNQYWWPLDDIDSRIRCMESCIRELDRGRKLNFFERLFRIFP